ncbi:MAG: hypothetical protein WBP93_04030 [Pyrinomonadaceae bacterium]
MIAKLGVGLLLATLALGVMAQRVEGKTHVLLLDVSGSMKERYANNMKGWLFEPLLRSKAFEPSDRVIVRWFDHRGSVNFDPNDRQRKYDGKYDMQEIPKRLPTFGDATGPDTDIPEGLELTLRDIEKLSVTGDVLIWLVTDNVQDVSGGGSVDPLYEKVKDDTNFQSAYVFPLTNENGVKVSPDKDAMVMYLLQFSVKPSRPGLDSLADDAGRKIGNAPVTWFPIERGVELNESNIRVNDEPSMLVDGKLKLPMVAEGTTPDFTLQFPFESKLRNLKIVKSKITPMDSKMRVPETVEANGDLNSWRGNITPTDLTLEAGKKSSVIYTTKLAGDMTFKPASFWNAVWNSTSDPVDVTFDYKLADVETQMDASALNQVKNLRGIENNVRQGQKKMRGRSIPMSFQVQFNSLWRRAVVGLVGLALFVLALGAASIFFVKKRYELSTPFSDQPQTLALPMVGRSYITINGDRAAVIKKQFGKLTVAPLGAYTINGALKAHHLAENLNSFEIASQVDQRRYTYTLNHVSTARAQTSNGRDTFLDS